jgi:hypothetical protein
VAIVEVVSGHQDEAAFLVVSSIDFDSEGKPCSFHFTPF